MFEHFIQFLHLLDFIFLYFFKGFICFLFKGFYLFACIFLYFIKGVILSFLKTSIIIFMRWDFRVEPCSSRVLGYQELVLVGKLGSEGIKLQ